MGRKASCGKQNVNRGAWSSEEDKILLNYVQVHGKGKWRELSKRAGLKRSGKSCRLRWLNYLKPDIKRGNISSDEEDLIIRLHNLLGNRWSLIAGRLPGRTDNEIKNYWNTYLRKKVEQEEANHKKHPGHSNKIPMKLRVESPPGCSKNNSLAIIDPAKSPHPLVKPKSVRCTKVMMPTNNDSVNTMNLITTSWDTKNPSSSTSQDDHNCSSGFFKDLDIDSDMLIPHEDCHFSRYACVEVPEQFGHDAFKFDNSVGEAWYENWILDDYFPLEQAEDFSSFPTFLI